jgi:hypothetical protein
MFAFSIVSAIKSPSLLRAAMPELSVLIDLMYWNSFLGLAWFFAGGWSGSFTGRSQMIDSM